MKIRFLSIAALAGCALALQLGNTVFADSPACDWGRVAIGGGGWFTGIIFHPKSTDADPVIYARGDLAGAFRWDSGKSRWINLGDSLPTETQYVRGCDGIAIDPSDSSEKTVYAVFGQYQDGHNYMLDDTNAALQGLYKSTDRGAHWTQILAQRAGSNQDSRWCGEPIAVDPQSGGKVIFYGTRANGLWISENGDAAPGDIKFSQGPDQGRLPTGQQNLGIRCIVFDPSTKSDNSIVIDGVTRTKHVYAALPKQGVYGSSDGGQTWAPLGALDGSKDMKRMVVLSDGSVVLAWDGPLSRYANGAWTPIAPGKAGFNCVASNPANPDQLVIGGGDSAFYHGSFFTTDNALEATPDKGWKGFKFSDGTAQVSNPGLWSDWNVAGGVDCIAVNPSNANEFWCTGVYGCWKAENDQDNPVKFTPEERDLEIAVVTSMASPASGDNKLLVGCGDVRGFLWKDLTAFPTAWIDSEGTCNYGATVSAGDGKYMTRINANSPWEGFSGATYRYSTDGGDKWNKGAMPKIQGNAGNAQMAISSDTMDTPHVVLLVDNGGADGGLYYSDNAFDDSTTWAKATATPDFPTAMAAWGIATLQADKKDPKSFYFARTPENGQTCVWVSSDYGHTWTLPADQTKDLPSGNRHPWSGNLATSPQAAGEVWFSSGPEGLFCSTDSAAHFKKIKSVLKVRAMTTGLARNGSARCAVYVLGQVQDSSGSPAWGLFISEDSGDTWTKMTTDSFQIPGGDYQVLMIADGQQFGRVYVSDGDTGIIVGSLK